MEASTLVCFSCVHFKALEGGCDAFPNGIPEEITSGDNQHAIKLKDQENDIIYEKQEKNIVN